MWKLKNPLVIWTQHHISQHCGWGELERWAWNPTTVCYQVIMYFLDILGFFSIGNQHWKEFINLTYFINLICTLSNPNIISTFGIITKSNCFQCEMEMHIDWCRDQN
jgi:hypothetical protein